MKHRLLLLLAVVLFLAATFPLLAADFTIKEIRFETADGAEHTETVHVMLNTLLYPTIFALVDGTPRVVCDFINAEPGPDIKRTIEINGQYIKRIRTGIHSNPKIKTRIVLDLVPDRDYKIQQIPSPKSNSFTLVVKVAASTGNDQVRDK